MKIIQILTFQKSRITYEGFDANKHIIFLNFQNKFNKIVLEIDFFNIKTDKIVVTLFSVN